MGATGHAEGPLVEGVVLGEELGKVLDHGCAGPRGQDDRIRRVCVVQLDQGRTNSPGLIRVAAVVGGLTAAGLAAVKGDLAPRPAEDLDCRLADARPELVNQAGGEERDPHRLEGDPVRGPDLKLAVAVALGEGLLLAARDLADVLEHTRPYTVDRLGPIDHTSR